MQYQHRPYTLCLAQFGATYATFYSETECGDVLSQVDMATTVGRIVLLNNSGFMMKRTREAIIRFPSFHKDCNSEEWYRVKIMRYVPWRNE